jgi:dihydroorotate dehydrogenase
VLYRSLIRRVLFCFDAESVHHFVLNFVRLFFKMPLSKPLTRMIYARGIRPMPVRLAGIELLNPIGLAAGFDKNANLVPGIENLGFGFIEIGTVTPRPQLGNARPRMLRVPEKRAIVNRMGFNNDGAERILKKFGMRFAYRLALTLEKIAILRIAKLLKIMKSSSKLFTAWRVIL